MDPIFTKSHKTEKMVKFFASLPLDKPVSFEEASKVLGFQISSNSSFYQYAKFIAERDHRCVVSAIRGFGFKRINGGEMVNRAAKFFRHVRKGARREARVQEIAVSTNLTREEMLRATEQLGRLRILESTSQIHPAATNAPDRKGSPGAIKAWK